MTQRRVVGAHTEHTTGSSSARMAVFKSDVQVHDAEGRAIGRGMAYVHLRLAPDADQRATGTVSLRVWHPDEAAPSWLQLADGRRLPIEVSLETLSTCSQNHILRYQADWPPVEPAASTDSAAHAP